jgi:hypothetical protein
MGCKKRSTTVLLNTMAPVTRSRRCQACGQPCISLRKETSRSPSAHGSALCSDCLLAIERVAEEAFESDDESNNVAVSSESVDEKAFSSDSVDETAVRNEAVDETVTSIYLTLSPDETLEEKLRQNLTQRFRSNSVLKLQVKMLHSESSQMYCELLDVQPQSSEVTRRMLTFEHISSGKPDPAALVSPETTRKRAASSSSKTCEDCNERTVPEEFMRYCERCFTLRCQKMRKQAGKCRLCKGAVSDPSFEYCLKCSSAKQRDDAKLAEQRLFDATQRRASAPVVPGVCTDCGAPTGDRSKTKCRPCVFRNPVQRPRLLHTPKKVLFIRKAP